MAKGERKYRKGRKKGGGSGQFLRYALLALILLALLIALRSLSFEPTRGLRGQEASAVSAAEMAKLEAEFKAEQKEHQRLAALASTEVAEETRLTSKISDLRAALSRFRGAGEGLPLWFPRPAIGGALPGRINIEKSND